MATSADRRAAELGRRDQSTAPMTASAADAFASGSNAALDRLLQPLGGRGADGTPAAASRRPEMLRRDGWSVYATPTPAEGEPVGAAFVRRDGTELHVVRDDAGRLRAPFDLDEAFASYVTEAFALASGNPRLSPMQLALFYRLKRAIPRSVQLGARRALARRQGVPSAPAWPLDEGMWRLLELHALTRLDDASELAFKWFWPEEYRAAVILTHDVEGEEGIRLVLELADVEQELGFRSAFNFGGWYTIDEGLLRELRDRGFEIGLHGLTHDRALFASRSAFEQRLPALGDLAERLGATGFRSPATHRVHDWLAELPVDYDCTIPHSDPYEPQPGGCCTLWPFFLGDSMVELPYTLPQDHTLLTLLGHETADLWLDTARAIEERYGLIQCVSHPDPGYLGDARKRAIYAEFLTALAERRDVWRALPRDVADWWRRRDAGIPAEGREGLAVEEVDGHVSIEPPRRVTDAPRALDAAVAPQGANGGGQ
jgi:peptidoglycan/xylan/chitin deacetylase (PgdA/CDA1 family)